MTSALVTIWRGGSAPQQHLALETEPIEDWRPAPPQARPDWSHFVVFEVTLGVQYSLDVSAEGPASSTFRFAVVRPDGGVLAARGFELPTTSLPAAEFFTP